MAVPLSGQVVGLAKWTDGTPDTVQSFCRVVEGGGIDFDFHNVRKVGVGGQLHTRKGSLECTLNATAVGVALVDIALFFPTAATTQVTFPDTSTGFLVEVDDATDGKEYMLSSCQPGSITIACGAEPDAEVTYAMVIKGVPQQAAVGTLAPTYNGFLGHTINDTTVQLVTSDINCLSWSLSNDLGVEMYNPMDTKSAGSLTLPTGYVVTTQNPRLEMVTADPVKWASATIVGDTWTAEDIVIALDNGTTAQDITITLDEFIPETLNMPFEGESLVGFAHSFAPAGTPTAAAIYNRVTLA